MKNKIILSLLCGLLVLGVTGCGNENQTGSNTDETENTKLVTTGITTTTSSLDIKDGSITLPEFQKIVTNKETDETTEEIIDYKSLKFLNSKNESLNVSNNKISVPNEDDTITAIYKENGKEFKTTIAIKAMKKYMTFGSSTLYFGQYNAEGDLPNGFYGVITINSDKTAIYVGSKFQENGKVTNVSLTGTWEVKAESIGGLQGPPDNPTKVDGIFFSWSDGSKDSYGVSKKYFGNQFMGYSWIRES